MKSRAYESPSRRAAAEATRLSIILALVDLIVDERPATISIPQVAKRAEVSVRTVYHYFPTKEALLDAVTESISTLVTLPGGTPLPNPTTPGELVEAVPAVVAYFAANARLFRALSVSEMGGRIASSRQPDRIARIETALEPLREQLGPDGFKRLRAAVGVAMSFEPFEALTERWGLTVDEAAEVMAWTVQTLCDRARRGVGE